MSVTIEMAVRVQRDFKMLDRHIVHIDLEQETFHLAHTQPERDNQAMISLTECAVHLWLSSMLGWWCPECFPVTGWYQVHEIRTVDPLVF